MGASAPLLFGVSMKKATAKRTFQRADTKDIVRAGDRIFATDEYIDDLARHGLVRNVVALPAAPETKVVPSTAVGAKPSVSPAAQALLDQTQNASKRGARKRKTQESL